MAAKILVVEDEPDIMRIISQALQSQGYEVIPAYGGEDAVRKLKTQTPDLILTDLAMPRVSGVSVIAAVKDDPEKRHIPVIAVTAHVWEGLAQSAGGAGCDGYLAKPFNVKQLLQIVKKYLSRAGQGGTGSGRRET